MLVNLVDPDDTARSPDGTGSLWFKLPKQDLKLLVRLEVGAMLFAPMKIDTVIVDLEAMTLVIVRRAQIGAPAEVRQLELGTWPDGTRMETTAAMAQLNTAQHQSNAQQASNRTASGPSHG